MTRVSDQRQQTTTRTDPRRALEELHERLERTPRAVRPLQHAAVRYELGMAYAELPTGDRQMNLSRAISHYEEAGRLFNADRFPAEHARVQIGRGAALRELGQQQQAGEAFATALDLLDPDSDDTAAEYGAALNNLGLVQSALGQHETAVDTLTRAETALARAGQPRQRIMALHNLGQALAAAGDDREAVKAYERALRDADREEIPYQWALLEHGRGVSLTAIGESEEAIRAFTAALRVFTRQRYPFQHALAKNNLGLAYAQVGGVAALRRAVASYEDALRLLDVRIHRPQWEQAYRNLELAESALEEAGATGTRAQHFAAMVVNLPDEAERVEVARERVMALLELPESQSQDKLAELYRAGLSLEEPGPRRFTAAWLNVLMELPNEQLRAGLGAVATVLLSLDSEAAKDRAGEMVETTIREELLAPQRMRVRDTLTDLGWERRF